MCISKVLWNKSMTPMQVAATYIPRRGYMTEHGQHDKQVYECFINQSINQSIKQSSISKTYLHYNLGSTTLNLCIT